MTISFQLYSAREFPPWEDVFAMLSDLGYENVEGFGGVYGDPSELRASLDAAGLSMPSGHFGLDELENDFDGVVETARTLGMERVFCPFLAPGARPADSAGWRGIAERLEKISSRARDAGLRFGWHNHDFEFAPCPDGAHPMRILLETAPTIEWEADIAWIVRGNGITANWIREFGERITTAHVKDMKAEGGETEDGWADVGHGTVDWRTIHGSLAPHCDLFVLEHDKPSDAKRFASRSIESFENILKGAKA